MKLLRFLCIAKIHFVDTDLISLVTAQMSYYTNYLIPLIKNTEFEIYRPISRVCQIQFQEGHSPKEFISNPAPTHTPCSFQISLND